MIGNISNLDAAMGALIFVSAFFSFIRGFSRELLSIVGWLGVSYLSITYSYIITPYIRPYVQGEFLARQISTAIIFILFMIIFYLIARSISKSILSSIVGFIDRVLGGAFGVARGILIISIIALFYSNLVTDFSKRPKFVRDSDYFITMVDLGDGIINAIPESVKNDILAKMNEIMPEFLQQDGSNNDLSKSDITNVEKIPTEESSENIENDLENATKELLKELEE